MASVVETLRLHLGSSDGHRRPRRPGPATRGTGRALLGIAGAPGAGKSTTAEQFVARIGPEAVVVPMDGFHLHDDQLARLGLGQRKGAPETFDVEGYVALLGRLRTETAHTVWAPAFDRVRELSVAAAIGVRPEHRLVVTEGNYLLFEGGGWSSVRPLLDEVWFVEQEESTRIERLVHRHVAHGKPVDVARRWTSSPTRPTPIWSRRREPSPTSS